MQYDINDLLNQLQRLNLDTSLQQQGPQLRRSTRERRCPSKFSDYELLFLEEAEPELLVSDQPELSTYKEACQAVDSAKWHEAMQDEMTSLQANDTWDLVSLPPDRRPLKNHWVYKLKEEDAGKKLYCARLVVKGFDQQKGINFNEIFSPVVRMNTIRVVLGLATVWDLELDQLDVKTTFLHGDVDEELYIEQPKGFKQQGHAHLYCRLKHSLYGLKQAPR